jgi:glyoxylase-like metal-dependent hydrolase (beta-lactamase superfamily II)
VAIFRRTFPVGALGCNCTIVGCTETGEALVVDPGDEAPAILEALARERLTAVKLVHTHAHFDHLLATGEVAAATGAEILLHRDDRWLWEHAVMQTEAFGVGRLDGRPWAGPPPPDAELAGDEALGFGRREARALHTPGHTPGSICLYIDAPGEPPLLLAGDTLFAGSIGRTDLWGGSPAAIVRSIQERLLTLPDDTVVVPGHGPETHIGVERRDNPFVGKSGKFTG